MSQCCGGNRLPEPTASHGCASAAIPAASDPSCAWFREMLAHCSEFAAAAQAAGRPIVGLLCEFTPREIVLAAGAVPVCLCGGSGAAIPAAEEHLPANLCPLIKSIYGDHLQRSNALLEMTNLVVGETTCDGKKKMYELMGQSRPMYILELPQMSDDSDALERWVVELQKFRRFLQSRWKVKISDSKLREAIGLMNRERALRRELSALLQSDPPPLAGRQLLDFKSCISGIPADLEQYARALAAFRAQGPDPKLAGRPRVLITGVPIVHQTERALEIIEETGGVVVALESCTGLKPLLEDVDASAYDPLRAIAEKYFHLPCSVMTPNQRRMDVLRQLATDYRPDCVVELVWQACLTYDVESYLVKQMVEQELGLPYLRIATDDSPIDSTQIAERVKALLEKASQRRK